MQIEEVPISQLKRMETNPRQMSDEQKARLRRSVEEFGVVEPLVINKDGTVIGGHQRLDTLEKMGRETIPCYRLDIPVEKAKLLNLALNRISGEWDEEKLAGVLSDLGEDLITLTGFNTADVERILTSVALDYGIPNLPKKVEIFQITLYIKGKPEYEELLERYEGKNVFEKTEGFIGSFK